MNTGDTGVRRDMGAQGPRQDQHQLRAALISADQRLKEIVTGSIQAAGLPIRIDFEIAVSSQLLDPEHLAQLRSSEPHIVILDMADDPERAIRAAGAIAPSLPSTSLVGVGPELGASRLLDAMRAGLIEYLPRPVEPRNIRDALGRVMRKRGWDGSSEGHRNGEVFAFFSAKGGSGSTSVVTNVGAELHRLTGRKTLLVDLDLELGEIASLLGVHPRFHFVDLIRNFHRMDEDLLASYIESHESGLQVLSAPFEPQIGEEVSGEQISHILGFLRNHYDYVLVDTSKSLAPPALAALRAADQIFLVTNMDVPSLRNLKRCLPILDRVTSGDASRLRLVVNRFNPKSLIRLADLEETLGIDVYWKIPNDFEAVIESISTGRPLVLNGNSRYAQQLKELAQDIAQGSQGTTSTKSSLVERLMSPLRSKSPRTESAVKPEALEASARG